MSDIRECLTALCPYDQTPQAAIAYLDSLPLEDGKRVAVIRVEAGDLTLERRVDMSLHASQQAQADPGSIIMDIQWAAHDGGLYPVFTGTLTVEDTGGNFCRLNLDGSYEPPLGFAGQLFDAVIGQRIALAACRQLLDDIKTSFELAFQTGMTIA
jgi:hypothetical protein